MNESDTKIEKDKILKRYSEVARMLGKTFEPILEVLVHDLTQPKNSVVAIYNNHISGRKVGDPASDFGLKRLEDPSIPDELFNYYNESSSGKKLKSSVLAIRDDEGKLIGTLCLNLDVSFLSQISRFVERLSESQPNPILGGIEKFTTKAANLEIKEAVEELKIQNNMLSKSLTRDDNKLIVRLLLEQGCFSKKGAITTIAKELQLTRPSIYKYLKEIQEEGEASA